MKTITAYFLLTLFASCLHASDKFDFFCLKPNENETAVLVLAPCMNGEFFLKESPRAGFAKAESCVYVYIGAFLDCRGGREWERLALHNGNIKIKTLKVGACFMPNRTSYF